MKLSVTQYAKQKKISRQAVLKRIKDKNYFPDLAKVDKIGNTYFITVKK